MSIILNKGLSTEYTFPRSFSIDPPPWGKRLNELERAYKHGSVITGDEMVKARLLRVWGTLASWNRPTYQTALDAMEAACYLKRLTLHADEWWPNRYLCVDCSDFSRDDYPTLFSGPVDILFRVTDPFWYSTTESRDAQNGIVTGYMSPIINSGQIEVSPTIHIRVAVGTVTSVILRNPADGNRQFTYTRTMTSPRGFRVRCATGEVHRWSGFAYFEDIAGFSAGSSFFRLQPGSNTLHLTVVGGSVNVLHVWRDKWLG